MKLKEAKVYRMTTPKHYDFLNRLTAIQALNSQQSTINSYTYLKLEYDWQGRRIQ